MDSDLQKISASQFIDVVSAKVTEAYPSGSFFVSASEHATVGPLGVPVNLRRRSQSYYMIEIWGNDHETIIQIEVDDRESFIKKIQEHLDEVQGKKQ